MGWWFGRILTFEIEADVSDVPAADILRDVSGGLIDCTASETVQGYAAHGGSLRAAVEPLIDCFGIELFDDERLRSAEGASPRALSLDELGCGSDAAGPKVVRSAKAAESLPVSVLLSYYDPERDFQSGQQKATLGTLGAEAQMQAPAVIEAVQARSMAETILARQWARRERVTVILPPAYMDVRPGQLIRLPTESKLWKVQRCTVEARGVELELCATEASSSVAIADPGRSVGGTDVIAAPTSIAVFDLPLPGSDGEPSFQIATASASAGWRGVGLRVDAGGEPMFASSAPRQSVMGHTLARLDAGTCDLFDDLNFVDVRLVDASDWLTSCDDQAMLAGSNLAAIGDELFQFGIAEPLGQGAFRLRHLLRGRRGTEWAAAVHSPNEPFLLVRAEHYRALPLSAAMKNSLVGVTPLGPADADVEAVSKRLTGEGLGPPAPVHVNVTFDPEGSLQAKWVRRSRSGWDWLDEVDVPLGEGVELYRVSLTGSAGVLTKESSVCSLLVPASEMAALGRGPATLAVCQIGDRAASRPALTSFHIA